MASLAEDAVVTRAPWRPRPMAIASRVSASSSTTRTLTPWSEGAGRAHLSPALEGTCSAVEASAEAPCCRGSRMISTAPDRSSRFRASTLPPCSSTRCRTMARPRPSPACLRVLRGVGLPEAVEDVRQERGIDPRTVVRGGSTRGPPPAAAPAPAPVGANFVAFDSRFQMTCCSRPASPSTGPTVGSIASSSWISLASAGGPHGVQCRFDHLQEAHRVKPSGNLPVMIRDTSRMSATSWAWARSVAIDGLDGTGGGSGIQARLAQDVRPRPR